MIKTMRQLEAQLRALDNVHTFLTVEIDSGGFLEYKAYFDKIGYIRSNTPEGLIKASEVALAGAKPDIAIENEPTVADPEQQVLFPDPMDGGLAPVINQIHASTEGLPPGPASAANIEEVYPPVNPNL